MHCLHIWFAQNQNTGYAGEVLHRSDVHDNEAVQQTRSKGQAVLQFELAKPSLHILCHNLAECERHLAKTVCSENALIRVLYVE